MQAKPCASRLSAEALEDARMPTSDHQGNCAATFGTHRSPPKGRYCGHADHSKTPTPIAPICQKYYGSQCFCRFGCGLDQAVGELAADKGAYALRGRLPTLTNRQLESFGIRS